LLAKVFGCYKLTFKKVKDKATGKAKVTHMNLLVMENLFYNRRFAKVCGKWSRGSFKADGVPWTDI
jgi:1-phosphatidylinositol-3-phosphate 5-kinase